MKQQEKPEAIIMKIPDAFFKEQNISYDDYIKFYTESSKNDEGWCFYHFINRVPVHPVQCCYICFGGKIQMKVNIVEFLKDQTLDLPGYKYMQPRDWMVGTGPVTKATEHIPAYKGRGFRYTKLLF